MLQSMRSGANSKILSAVFILLLALATGGLVLMDVTGFVGQGTTQGVVATVGERDISVAEFENAVRNKLRETPQVTMQEAYKNGTIHEVLRTEIQNELLIQATHDLNLSVSDQLVAERIRQLLKPLTDEGMPEDQALEQLLYNQRSSEARFVSLVRSQIGAQKLLEAVVGGGYAPNIMLDNAMEYQNENRTASYFKLEFDAFAPGEPDEETLKDYYKSVAPAYANPEYRAFKAVVLDLSHVEDKIEVSEDELRAAYEDRIDEFTTPGGRSIVQAVAPDEEMAKKIAELARGGADLKKAITEAGGDEDMYISAITFSAGDLPNEDLETAVNEMETGQISDPVQSPLGWHVMYLEGVVDDVVTPFEEVREDVRKEVVRYEAEEELYELSNELADEIAGGASLEDAAAVLQLKTDAFPAVTRNGQSRDGVEKPLDGLPAREDVLEAVFTHDIDHPSNLIESRDGEFVVISVTDIVPVEERPLADVRDKIVKRWKKERRINMAREKLVALREQMKEGASFEDIAKEAGVEITHTPSLSRVSPPEGFDKSLIQPIFDIAEKGAVTDIQVGDGVYAIRLTDISYPDELDPALVERKGRLKQLMSQTVGTDILALYIDALSVKYGVDINEKILEARFAASDEASY